MGARLRHDSCVDGLFLTAGLDLNTADASARTAGDPQGAATVASLTFLGQARVGDSH